MAQSSAFLRNITRQNRELEQIVATITNMNAFTRNVRNEAARKIQKAWKVGRRREVRQLMRNMQAGHVNNLTNEFKRLDLINKNNQGNVIMTNAAPMLSKKRKVGNSNEEQTTKTRAREVNLPNRTIGRGMSCSHAGVTRYMKKAKKRFDELGYVSAYLDYDTQTNQYGITKNIDTIVKRKGQVYNSGSRINSSPQVYFFMIGIRGETSTGHAVSVLVDARVAKNKRIWVFDPHGVDSRKSLWGITMRKKVVPIIRKLFKIPGRKVKYYNGRDLQSNNTRGVCTTFYVTFMDIIPYLLNGSANINQLSDIARINSTQIRAFFLNFAPNTEGRVTVKNRTR
jgi:hypothetical protein